MVVVPCVILKPSSISRLSIQSDSFNLQLSLQKFLQLQIEFFYVHSTKCLSEQAHFLNHKALQGIYCEFRSRILNLRLEKIQRKLDHQRVKMEIKLKVYLRTYISSMLSLFSYSCSFFTLRNKFVLTVLKNRKKMGFLPG